jgi:N,N'-diacetyllegionaminate synthase
MSNMMIICEIGQAHDGSLGILHSYIDALAGTGVNIVKFQTHIAHAESSIFEPFRIDFSREDKTRFDYWKRMELSFDQWKSIKTHCENVGLEFMSSPFSIEAVELLEKLNVKRYKIGSGEISNMLLLNRIKKTRKPIILSSGMSSLNELDKAVKLFIDAGTEVMVLQCTTEYPTNPESWGLNMISELRTRYRLPVGYSDHSGDIYSSIAATALGAEIIEFHVTFHKKMFGPDTSSSVQINDVPLLVKGINQVSKALKNPVQKNDLEKFKVLKKMFEKSLAVNKDLKQGHVLRELDLETKKPRDHGIPASDFEKVIGKKLQKDLKAWEFLNWNDFYE